MREDRKEINNLIFRRATGFFIRRKALLIKGKIQKQKNHQHQSSKNLYLRCYLKNIKAHKLSISVSILTVNNKKSVPKMRSYVKIQNPPVFDGSRKLKVIRPAANQPAERLIDSPDNAFSHAFDGLINLNLANSYVFVKQGICFSF